MMLSFQASYGKVNKDVVDPLIVITLEMNKVSLLQFERSTMEPSDVVEVREIQKTFLQMKNSLMSFALFAPRDVVVDMLNRDPENIPTNEKLFDVVRVVCTSRCCGGHVEQ